MGTTAVVLLLDGTKAAWVAHVGDSRAYRLRDKLWDEVPDGEIAEVLQRHTPADVVRLLVAEANHRAGPDNITVQVAVIPQLAAEAEWTSGGEAAQQLNTPPLRQNRWALRASARIPAQST